MKMSNFLRVLTICALSLLGVTSVSPQSSPGLVQGQVPTPAQWNSYFAAKQDFVGGTPLSVSGGTMTGELVTTASTNSIAGFNVPPGVAPTVPVNGDFWTTAAGVFARVNGVSVNLTAAATGLSTTGGTMTGELITAVPTSGTAMLNLPHGASPTSPVNGDLWTTTGGLFARVNGSSFNLTTITAGQLPAFGSGDVSFAVGGGAGTIAAGAVTNTKTAAMTQNAVKGAATSTSQADLSVPSCSAASSALTWTSNTGFGCNTIAAGATTGLKQQLFTASGTFTIPAGTVSGTLFKFTITGGGGSGGAGNSGAGAGGGGGSAGGTAIVYLSNLTAASTITVTVGGAATNSSISSGSQTITTVTGLAGSTGGNAAAATDAGSGATGGGTTNATIDILGGDGTPGGTANGTTVPNGSGGNGGSSYWGGGGAGGAGTNAGGNGGSAGKAWGSGGGGGAGNGSGSGGKAGIVSVEWVL